MKKIHLIAIGGAIMHNLAIALKNMGYDVSGSDDAIHDPAKTNLEAAGMLPQIGWNENLISSDIDQVILGMHARVDNPELLKAQELQIPIVSFPEFIAQMCSDKMNVVIGGSHGKTSTTAMIMYALAKAEIDFDYLVGSSIDGFELSVKLSNAPLIIIEGDEYLSSPIDRRSKFLWYKPNISILTGIAYDHINVFPTFESYLDTFKTFIEQHRSDDTVIWFNQDAHLAKMMQNVSCRSEPYGTPKYSLKGHQTYFSFNQQDYPLELIGEHNLQNLQAAMMVCEKLGITPNHFLEFMADFTGAGRRMEKIYEKGDQIIIRDFAHSPSKLKATVDAVKNNYTNNNLLAVFELHTFSSLNKEFLPYYKGSMKSAERAVVYIDPEVFVHRKMESISNEFIANSFDNVEVCSNKSELELLVNSSYAQGDSILLMSSGTFSKASFTF